MTIARILIDLAAAAASVLRAGLAALDMLWPKALRLVAFGHHDVTDNGRALFGHLSLSGGPLRAVWLTEDEAQAAMIAAAVPGACAVTKRSARGLPRTDTTMTRSRPAPAMQPRRVRGGVARRHRRRAGACRALRLGPGDVPRA